MQYGNYPSLQHKVVLVTGGATGIGAAFVKEFTLQGSQVAFVDIDDEAGETLCQRLVAERYARPLFIHCDLIDIDALKKAIQHAYDVLGNINVLINNAGSDLVHSTIEVNEFMWDELMNINLRQQFFCAQSVVPMMTASGGGSIINISSNCFLLSQPPSSPCYVIAKSAMVGLTRSLAYEFGNRNIRVNSILPGTVLTERLSKVDPANEQQHHLLQQRCIKHHLLPEDVARLALFLAADDSRMITKQCFIADGGRA